jgi:predicted ATP-binding protein involved in virulence
LEDYIKAYKRKGKEKKVPADASLIETIDNGYLKEVEISNFFCIKNIKLDNLQDRKEIYLVGENGDGKTIFLQAVLLAFKGDRNVGEIINFIKQNPMSNYSLKVIDDTNSTFVFSESSRARETIAKNVFAYGVHRSRNDSDKADEYGYLTLFLEDQYLKNPVKWLQYLHHKEKAKEKPPIRLNTAVNMLKSLLSQNVDIEVTPDAVTFEERKTRVAFSQLADGYKSVIIWVCDLIEKLSKNQPRAESIRDFKGIVLLDEIELFLHPKWKYNIVRDLRHWFPGIQFIFTTHSSTAILGASKDAVFYKLYKENGITKVSQPVSGISNLMLNGIVTSPLFDLESAQASSFEEDIPRQLESTEFRNKILQKIPDKKDKTFIKTIYKESKEATGGSIYVLKDDLNTKEINRLIKILINIGYKEKLDTSTDFLYFIIHQEIENRIRKMNNITENEILDMVKKELDKYEESLKYAQNK